MRIYGEITKLEPLDDGTLKVVGVASSGAVDEADERVSPAAMKAALPAYMRFGALREMHGLSAAGATLSAEVDGTGQTRIEAHVVDPVAVKKVRLGVYKGFSIGGRVLEHDPADHKVITALKLDEISLVDRPCNPEAVIHMWKADGLSPPASRGPTNAEVVAKAIELAAAAGKRGRHTEFVVKARQALIETAASRPADAALSIDPPLSQVLDKLGARNSQTDLAHIQAAHDELGALGAKCGSDGESDPNAGNDAYGCDRDEPDEAPSDGDLTKAPIAASDDLSRQLVGLRRDMAILQKRFDDLSAQPLPPRTLAGWARAVSKTEDAGGASPISAEALRKHLESLNPEERAQLELRAALSRPVAIHGR